MPLGSLLENMSGAMPSASVMYEHRAGLAQKIGDAWFFVQHLKDRLMPELQRRLAEGVHPLDAVCHHAYLSWTLGGRMWGETEIAQGAIRKRLDLVTLLLSAHAGFADRTIVDTVIRGALTGTQIVVGVEEVIPARWERQFGTPMPRSELDRSLSREGLMPLLAMWKGMKSEYVNPFERLVKYGEAQDRDLGNDVKRSVLNPDAFELAQSDDGVWMPIPSENVVRQLETLIVPPSPYPVQGQCPSYSAYDPTMNFLLEVAPRMAQNVLMQHIDWIIGLSRTHWLPTVAE